MTDPNTTEIAVERTKDGLWRGRLSGVEAYQVLVALLIVGCTVVMIWQIRMSTMIILESQERSRDSILRQHEITLKLLSAVSTENAKIIENQTKIIQEFKEGNRVVAYVLSRTEKERQQLDLEMPESLRRPINRR